MIKVCLIPLEEFEILCGNKIKDHCSINLTKREKEILNLVTQGKSNSEIGKELYLSEFTVKNYVSQIIEKLEVKNRIQATVKAIKNGLV